MLILGVILLVLGWALGIGLLTTLGIILAHAADRRVLGF
jgi:ABC-type transport system involved in cytochrome bd biosynthesis fused ATPase/permease subunit